MLTQKTTKYSYARRILALPILFIVSFALLVNAKNKEIKNQNKEIEIAVQSLKKDTLNQEIAFGTDGTKFFKKHPELFLDTIKKNSVDLINEKLKNVSEKLKKDNEKIATLSAETAKKSEELKKIAKEKGTDNYEYELKAKDLDRLGDEIDRIANSADYKNSWKEFEFNFDELNDEINTKDLKNSVIKIRKLRFPENIEAEIAPLPPVEFENFNWTDKSNLSKEEIKKLEKLSKQRAGLAKQQAELSKKQADIAKQQAEISRKYAQNNPWVIGVNSDFPKDDFIYINADNIKNDLSSKAMSANGIKSFKANNLSNNTKIYINGKLSKKEEMDKIKPENITTININKNKNNDKEESEIRIQTK